MRHIFPFLEISKNERIVLYGASERGYDFYRQIISTGYAEVVLWVDRQYEWYRYLGLPIDAPKRIEEIEYDRIVVTAETESVFESIKRDLLKMNVDQDKIFWKSDCLIKGNLALGYDKERILLESQKATLTNPNVFVDETRLDIVIRVLYAKDCLNGEGQGFHQSLYKKLMMIQNNGKEPTDNMISAFFSEYSTKAGWKAFDESFRSLIFSVKEEGFKKKYFVPVSKNGHLINGAHRVAAAISNQVDIWFWEYPVEIKPLIFDKTWLTNNDFSEEEVAYVLEKYREIKSCTI